MNRVDLVLGILLAISVLRGYWRGFVRECFGVLALVAGAAAALQFTEQGVAVVQQHVRLPVPVQTGATFVAIFVMVHSSISVLGVLLNRGPTSGASRLINSVAGAIFGVGKAAAVLAVALLFLHLLPIIPALDGYIMTSAVARPLVATAADMLRSGSGTVVLPVPSRQP